MSCIETAFKALGEIINERDFEIMRLKWEVEDLKKTNAEYAEKIRHLTEPCRGTEGK